MADLLAKRLRAAAELTVSNPPLLNEADDALVQAHAELDALRHDIARRVEITATEATRAEAAEGRADEATRVLELVSEWYDRDGSVGGCSLMMDDVRAFLDAAKKEG